MQIPGGPPTGDIGAVAQLLLSLAGFVGVLTWGVFKVMDRKEAKKNGNPGHGLLVAEIAGLANRVSEFEGRISERTKIHGEAIDQLRAEFAARPWHKISSDVAALIGESELRLTDRMNRIELRLENRGRK